MWSDLSTLVLDRILGWTLSCPRDIGLVILALLSAGLLLALRLLLVSRNTMLMIQQDQRKLNELTAQAKRSADLDALRRLRLNRGRVATRKLFTELPAVTIGVFIFATLLQWGAENLDALPLQPGVPFETTLELPASSQGMIVHLVPEEGLQSDAGWVKRVDRTSASSSSQATWRLTAKQGTYTLTFNIHGEALHHQLTIDGRSPPAQQVTHEPLGITRIKASPYRPAGVIGKVGRVPAWLVGFLLILSPVYLGARRIPGIP